MSGMTATEFVERRDRNNRKFADAVAVAIKAPRDIEALGEVVKAIMGEEFPQACDNREQFAGMCHRLAELWQFANDSLTDNLAVMRLGDAITNRTGLEIPPRGHTRDAGNVVVIDEAKITGILRMIDLGEQNIPALINDARASIKDRVLIGRDDDGPSFIERLNRQPWEKR